VIIGSSPEKDCNTFVLKVSVRVYGWQELIICTSLYVCTVFTTHKFTF